MWLRVQTKAEQLHSAVFGEDPRKAQKDQERDAHFLRYVLWHPVLFTHRPVVSDHGQQSACMYNMCITSGQAYVQRVLIRICRVCDFRELCSTHICSMAMLAFGNFRPGLVQSCSSSKQQTPSSWHAVCVQLQHIDLYSTLTAPAVQSEAATPGTVNSCTSNSASA